MKTYGFHCGLGQVKLASLLTALMVSGTFPAYAASTTLQQSYLLLDGKLLINPGMRFIRGKDGPIDDTFEVTVRNSLEKRWPEDRPTMVPAIEITYSKMSDKSKMSSRNRREDGFERTVTLKDGSSNNFEDYYAGNSCILHFRKANESGWGCVTAIEGDVFDFSTGKTEKKSLNTVITDRRSSILVVLDEREARDAFLSFVKNELNKAGSGEQLHYFIQKYKNTPADELVKQARIRIYSLEFDRATNIGSLKEFINKYSVNDPSGLIPKAKRKLYQAEFKDATTTEALQDFIDRYQSDDPDELVSQARSKVKSIAIDKEWELNWRRGVQEKLNRQSAAIKQYQTRLTVNSLTNCGKVVGKKGAMLEIHHPLAGYGNIQLIEPHRLFPANRGFFPCIFVNGNYQYYPPGNSLLTGIEDIIERNLKGNE